MHLFRCGQVDCLNLTLHADYSLRILLYLSEHTDRPVSTQEISEAYGISRNHLVRVVQRLQSHSFVNASVGRSGGLTLALDPAEINIGQVVRKTEPNFRIVECFEPETNTCKIAPVCKLRGVLAEALRAFVHVLDGYTLADVARMNGTAPLSSFLAIQKANPQPPVRTESI
ncbi:MAG: Rrf2 family transcriptional regulator, nitric oxide-sensitive transcriptional repressor [Bryobacterales bacterium]|nr:Rrf2 family transcriptional regulator, nitric oxide-sensitive transcriptional repressor [Bryobacterales bacterium]